MALVLNEEQIMLRDAARDFLGNRAPVSHLRQLRDSEDTEGFSRELWTEMAEMGWAAIIIPEAYGGLDYGYTGLGLVLEESGRTLTPSPLLSTALLGTSALILSANEALCEQWLSKIATGEKLLSLAFEESSQHRPVTVNTRAEPDGDGYRLNGAKLAVIDGPPTEFDSLTYMFEETLAHEKKVTALINGLVDLAVEEKDHATEIFLQWFVTEQIEEEESANDILSQLKLAGDAGGGLFMIDKELAARVFTPPAAAGE